MTFWTPDNLRAATGGAWLHRPPLIELPKDRPADMPLPPLHAPITGLSTDSRTIKPGQAFLALKGENFDGHAYLAEVARGGSPILIVQDAAQVPERGFQPACGVLKVEDTGKALLRIAAAYRKSLARTKVIAVCGSNGKTTTTRLISQILSRTMRGAASVKSFNNSIGVPLTILGAKENDQYLICEVGTNAPGEIAELGAVVQPDIAVVTSIGREHLEKLGDIAGVAKEEAAIFAFLRPTGCAIITADSPELAEHAKSVKNLITFGRSPEATIRLASVKHAVGPEGMGLVFTTNARQEFRLPLVGEHNALNALAAVAVARRLGVDERRAAEALATAGGAEMRLTRLEIGGMTVLNDAYNANPDSMIAGIDTALSLRAAGMGPGRTVLVLGEMLELGAASADAHIAVAKHIADRHAAGKSIDLVALVGAGMQAARDHLMRSGWTRDRVAWFPNADGDQAAEIAGLCSRGDLVLIKGSRRVKLERVVAAMQEGSEPDDEGEAAARARRRAPGGVLVSE